MSAIELVQIERSALDDLLYRVSKRAAADALAKQAVDFHRRLVLTGSIGHSADKRRRKK